MYPMINNTSDIMKQDVENFKPKEILESPFTRFVGFEIIAIIPLHKIPINPIVFNIIDISYSSLSSEIHAIPSQVKQFLYSISASIDFGESCFEITPS